MRHIDKLPPVHCPPLSIFYSPPSDLFFILVLCLPSLTPFNFIQKPKHKAQNINIFFLTFLASYFLFFRLLSYLPLSLFLLEQFDRGQVKKNEIKTKKKQGLSVIEYLICQAKHGEIKSPVSHMEWQSDPESVSLINSPPISLFPSKSVDYFCLLSRLERRGKPVLNGKYSRFSHSGWFAEIGNRAPTNPNPGEGAVFLTHTVYLFFSSGYSSKLCFQMNLSNISFQKRALFKSSSYSS